MISDQQRSIYQSEGDRYQALIAREDYQGNIPPAIDEILRVDGLDILDLGAGTGRLTLLLGRRARSIYALDASSEMLRVCRAGLIVSGLSNWDVDVADHRRLPLANHWADLAVAGWSVSYLAVWNQEQNSASRKRLNSGSERCESCSSWGKICAIGKIRKSGKMVLLMLKSF